MLVKVMLRFVVRGHTDAADDGKNNDDNFDTDEQGLRILYKLDTCVQPNLNFGSHSTKIKKQWFLHILLAVSNPLSKYKAILISCFL